MPTVMVVLNIILIGGVVTAILGLLAWGIVTDRPFATYLTNRAEARALGITDRRRHPDRRRESREVSGYRGPGRRAVDFGA